MTASRPGSGRYGASLESQDLSSRQTFFLKFIVAPLWISGFGYGVRLAWSHEAGGPTMPAAIKWLLFLIWIIGTAHLWRVCIRLKRVRRIGSVLHISNYVREITVLLTDIERVSEARWVQGRPITLHFAHDTPFGYSIVFMPAGPSLGAWPSHRVTSELEQAIEEARMRQKLRSRVDFTPQ